MPRIKSRSGLFVLLCALALLSSVRALAQGNGYTVTQITTTSKDHRWPALDNDGSAVWCEYDGANWQVVKADSISANRIDPPTSNKTTDAYDHKYPAYKGGNLLYAKHPVGGGIQWAIIKDPNSTVQFSSRDNLSGAHRDAGRFSAVAKDGTTVTWYDWYPFAGDYQGRRLEISGFPRYDSFAGYDHPDINTNKDLIFSDGTNVYKATANDPGTVTMPGAGAIARINDGGDIVAVVGTLNFQGLADSGNVVLYKAPGYASGITIHTGIWASINNNGDILFEDVDANGKHQIYLAKSDAPSSTVTIESVEMLDERNVEVKVTGHFSKDNTTSKLLTVKTTINGIDLSSPYILNPTDVGDQQATVLLDLEFNQVPRFTDNVVFDVSAKATEDGIDSEPDIKKNNEIPLPVVHIHGVLTDVLGDRIPHELFQYLLDNHKGYTPDLGSPDALNRLNHLTAAYPTLVSYDYSSVDKSAAAIAQDFSAWMQLELLPKTHAAKVNIVAHSLGGIISRAAIAYNGANSFVNKLILVGSPSEGATLASIALSDWFGIKTLIALLQISPLDDFSSVATILDGLAMAKDTTTHDLLPTYNWWALNQQSAQQNRGLIIPPGYENKFLSDLNKKGLSSQVLYYDITAGGWRPSSKFTYYTLTKMWGKFWLLNAGKAVFSDPTAFQPGDGVVPLESQLALNSGWTYGNGPGELNIARPDGTARDAGNVFHTNYFNVVLVQQDIEEILWGKQ